MTILVTGGAGFIGVNFVRGWLARDCGPVVNLDKLTYAGNLDSLRDVAGKAAYRFVHGDIGDGDLVGAILAETRPTAIVNFAAESHVDRSISGPDAFIETNVVATFRLLEAVRTWWAGLDRVSADGFRFVHVSTDEVYGSLGPDDPAFTERHRYEPNSPYSASKAASDHLVRATHRTYGLPVVTTNCSNNYGPYQFPEKLLPLCLHRALAGETLPIYGDGGQVRDWLHVDDHCAALRLAIDRGEPGEVYNVGGTGEKTNIETVKELCGVLDRLSPRSDGQGYAEQICFVEDRPGHDRRYAVDTTKIRSELGWAPEVTFEDGLDRTARWYIDNSQWVERVTSGAYRDWIETQYRT